MKTIWKFPLAPVSPLRVEMPQGAMILTVEAQADAGCIWAIVDPNAEKEIRYFETYGTGHLIPEGKAIERAYVGTYQVPPYVWHVFERLIPQNEQVALD